MLRYLTVRVEEHEEGPSAMMRKADRDRDRDDRGGGLRRPRRRSVATAVTAAIAATVAATAVRATTPTNRTATEE